MTRDRVRERADQRQKRHKDRGDASLQPAWRADADQLPHEQAEIEAASVNQQPLQDVWVTAKVGPSHAAGLIHVREGTFQQLAPHPLQPPASLTAG